MPWRLIGFIAVFAVFLAFTIFNLENKSGVNLGFVRFDDVPVFVTAFCSLIAGMLLSLPSMLGMWLKGKTRKTAAKKPGEKQGRKKAGKEKPAKTDSQDGTPEDAVYPNADSKEYGID
jgi:uncharacterized integral membrane protein